MRAPRATATTRSARPQDERHSASIAITARARLRDLEELFIRVEPNPTVGSCILRRPEVATIVQNALLFFEGRRYYLSSWCVMPNRVHVVVSPKGSVSVASFLHSWKSFTADAINRSLGRSGSVWERESFDHLIRSADAWQRCVEYTEQNPVTAGLWDTPEHWPYSSRGTGFRPSPEISFVGGRNLPYARMRTRGELPHLYKEGGTYFVTFRLADSIVLRGRR